MGDVVDLLAPNPAAGTNAAIAATAVGDATAMAASPTSATQSNIVALLISPAPATFAATIANGNGCGSVGRGPVSAEQANDALRAITAINTPSTWSFFACVPAVCQWPAERSSVAQDKDQKNRAVSQMLAA